MKDLSVYQVNGYVPVIGIECHVQLKTKTKLFAAVANDARNADPNTLISHICFGLPGALPVLNEKAVEYAIRAALAFNTKPQKFSYFERKHYFYPDLPKGYQITQLAKPIIVGGTVAIETDYGKREIELNRVQLEEDAGKNTHPPGADYSLVDLNRAGTPLLEIVSEPVIHSSSEAKAYARELYLLMRYADVSDADMYHGNMRFDVNVSVTKDVAELGTRTETKNLNSFKSVERAVEYEIARQIDLLEKGETIIQETRGWDDAKQKTTSQRSKEEAHDYRYFPEPDIPPVVVSEQQVKAVADNLQILPGKLRQVFLKKGLTSDVIETLLDAMPASRLLYDVISKNVTVPTIRRITHWLTTEIKAMISESKLDWEDLQLTSEQLIQLDTLVSSNQLSSSGAKTVLRELAVNGGEPLSIAQNKNVLQVSDEGEIKGIVQAVIRRHTKAAEDIKKGETKAIGFLVGQVMKESRGKANPSLAQKLIKDELGV